MNDFEKRFFDRLARRVATAGEPFHTFFEPADLATRLRRFGFSSVQDYAADALNARYFAGRRDGLRVAGLAHSSKPSSEAPVSSGRERAAGTLPHRANADHQGMSAYLRNGNCTPSRHACRADRPMKTLLVTGAMALMASHTSAQTPDSIAPWARTTATVEDNLATATGHEVSAGIASYTYREPGAQAISIHGATFVGDYTGTLSIDKRQHWFTQGDLRGTLGNVAYDGWCSPFLITPSSESPNGYELDVGSASPCSETGDKDWYLEARALTGKDFVGQRWAWSPYTGLGLRHLSNGTTGIPGYRTDDYLYVPVGITARNSVASHGVLSLDLEFDRLIHGWQKTRDSDLGGGDVPATTTAPAFTIDGFTDIAFSQSGGWALRASAKCPVTSRLSLEPYDVRWNVSSSPVNYEIATFTVNNVTAQEQLGAYEPVNVTNEFGVRLGLHF